MKNNQKGFADITVILILIAVVAVGGFAYWRISSNKQEVASIDTAEQIEELESLPTSLDGLKTLEEVEVIAGATDDVTIVGFVLETKDGDTIYIVTLSNGKKLIINASSGAIISEETTDISEDNQIPDGVNVTISPSEAYGIASALSSSPIVQIEFEVEDKKVTYKVEYRDGSKVEIDASTGEIVKSEIKDESKTEEESEDEQEDTSDEDVEKSEPEEDKSDEDKSEDSTN